MAFRNGRGYGLGIHAHTGGAHVDRPIGGHAAGGDVRAGAARHRVQFVGPQRIRGHIGVTDGLLADHVGGLDRVLQGLRRDLVQSRGFDQRLARGLDVQILVHVIGALDVGVSHPLVLVVGGAASGVGILERLIRPSLELAFALVRSGYFGHIRFVSLSVE
jgi:hypothetical protein